MYHSSYINKLNNKLDRIFDLAPNDLHLPFLTNTYKMLTQPLKSLPLAVIIPISFAVAAIMYLVFGSMVVQLVSLLQHGF